jgi:ParB family chromosome partitioning protein
MARRSMADLAAVPTMTAPVPALGDAPPRLLRVPPAAVAPNPVNPRTNAGDLADLESMKTAGQLQACLVVTRPAFLAIHPEHETTIGAATYVVVAGTRRRLAAEQFGLPTLDVVVRDAVAIDRLTFFGVSILENVDREQLSPLDEARAVERLAAEAGHGGKGKAAEQLGKSAGWVSQRLALLRLCPAMQDLLRAGELPIREARSLALLPAEEQEPAWRS